MQVGVYLEDADYEPERVRKASVAAFGLCKWVRAMVTYHEVQKEVYPKQLALRAAQHSFAEAQAKLRKARAALEMIEAKLAKIEVRPPASLRPPACAAPLDAARASLCSRRARRRSEKIMGGHGRSWEIMGVPRCAHRAPIDKSEAIRGNQRQSAAIRSNQRTSQCSDCAPSARSLTAPSLAAVCRRSMRP